VFNGLDAVDEITCECSGNRFSRHYQQPRLRTEMPLSSCGIFDGKYQNYLDMCGWPLQSKSVWLLATLLGGGQAPVPSP
jgi:hypothetical protein